MTHAERENARLRRALRKALDEVKAVKERQTCSIRALTIAMGALGRAEASDDVMRRIADALAGEKKP